MKISLVQIALRSLFFHGKESVYQLAIISILAAIICGSLLTGHSVRSSLRRNLSEKTGNADFLISSGIRYFDASIAKRFADRSGLKTAAITETKGFCQNFTSGATVLDVNIYGTDPDFFLFQGSQEPDVRKGYARINESLAAKLDLHTGDEIIIGYKSINPLPSNTPFAPGEDVRDSRVLIIESIITGPMGGNFSLGTSQSVPLNIFVNARDIEDGILKKMKANRLLVNANKDCDPSFLIKYLQDLLTPRDIGLSVRISQTTSEPELISERIFIDSAIISAVSGQFPSSAPLITYLANSLDVRNETTPYSFITALTPEMIPELEDNEIIINRWLAEDLKAGNGDTLHLTWFDPGSGKNLKESAANFIVRSVAEKNFRYSDPSLMPEFPGISGSTTCSSWDAGVPLKMEKIRDKDEDYWTRFKGTPKAFITYATGRRLWGNNFGPATAIRFDLKTDSSEINQKLTGNINPSVAGFSFTDLNARNARASSEGVDFGMLFLGLSLFIIISCIILLWITLRLYLDSRKNEIRTYHALGFRNGKIKRIVFYEAFFIASIGAIAGAFLGYLVNILIINALNGVWTGAVQTDTLTAGFSFLPLVTGTAASLVISAMLILIRLGHFLRELERGSKEIYKRDAKGINSGHILLFLLVSLTLLVLSVIVRSNATILAFAGGSLLFVAMILGAYHFFEVRKKRFLNYSGLYYSYYPSKATAPVVFLAAGIFAIIITGANRQVVSEKMSLPGGGTGGFLLWAESAIPVDHDLNSQAGKRELGLTKEDFGTMTLIQARKLAGDDASCLNITHVTAPPLLGIDPGTFIRKGSFSFASKLKVPKEINPWSLLRENPGDNIIYGIADQTVLQWGLKIRTGDTLEYVAENGQPLKIVICGGLKSSVFQGHLLIGLSSFEKQFPSVSGYSVFLADGSKDSLDLYRNAITERLSGYGISVEPAIEKLASFFRVTNTYLEVFMMLGAFGMILGVAGLGFILIKNFNSRKREFALMIASGYSEKRIRKLLLREHLLILILGLLTGTISALSATWPSVLSGADMPWALFTAMLLMVFIIGYSVVSASVNLVKKKNIITFLKRE